MVEPQFPHLLCVGLCCGNRLERMVGGGEEEGFLCPFLRFQLGLCFYQALSGRACSVMAPGSHYAPALGQGFLC